MSILMRSVSIFYTVTVVSKLDNILDVSVTVHHIYIYK